MIDVTPAGQTPTFQEAQTQLRKILGCLDFQSCKTLRKLLEFLVLETLLGRGSRLKSYTIGIEVFNRPPDFDVRQDSIVRVSARKLRQKLEEYYGGFGKHDLLRLEIPKGSYRPKISYNNRPAVPRDMVSLQSAPTGIVLPIVRVPPIEVAGNSPELGYFASALTQQLKATLSASGKVSVICESKKPWSGPLQRADSGSHAAPHYLLSGFTIADQRDLQVFINLHNYATQTQLLGHMLKDSWNPETFLANVEHYAEQACNIILAADSPLMKVSVAHARGGPGSHHH